MTCYMRGPSYAATENKLSLPRYHPQFDSKEIRLRVRPLLPRKVYITLLRGRKGVLVNCIAQLFHRQAVGSSSWWSELEDSMRFCSWMSAMFQAWRFSPSQHLKRVETCEKTASDATHQVIFRTRNAGRSGVTFEMDKLSGRRTVNTCTFWNWLMKKSKHSKPKKERRGDHWVGIAARMEMDDDDDAGCGDVQRCVVLFPFPLHRFCMATLPRPA